MKYSSPRKIGRLGNRYGRIVLLLVIVGLVIFSSFQVFQLLLPRLIGRTSILVVGNPIIVWSWEDRATASIILTLPPAVKIEGVHGYGRYSLEALWRLGNIDKNEGKLLAQSLEETIGLPISWYVGPSGEIGDTGAKPLSLARDLFSWTNIGFITGSSYRTNIPLWGRLALIGAAHILKPQSVKVIDFQTSSSVIDLAAADGSIDKIIDVQRLDYLLGQLFEDEQVRQERLTVSIFNTTNTPYLGQRVSRLLSRLGIFVVFIDNARADIEQCEVIGSAETEKSVTVSMIVRVLGCQFKVGAVDRADVSVRIGHDYENKFLPSRPTE